MSSNTAEACVAYRQPTYQNPTPTPNNAADRTTLSKIKQVRECLDTFIMNCDAVCSHLSNELKPQVYDASNSYSSFFNFFISPASYERNSQLATKVDNLQHEAIKINQVLVESGLFANTVYNPISTDFNGSSFVEVGNFKYRFLTDTFVSSTYNSYEDMDTLGQIVPTKAKISVVRLQATNIRQILASMEARFATPFSPFNDP